jgi:pimeloyl-ACP methyl ester carboxylesterase
MKSQGTHVRTGFEISALVMGQGINKRRVFKNHGLLFLALSFFGCGSPDSSSLVDQPQSQPYGLIVGLGGNGSCGPGGNPSESSLSGPLIETVAKIEDELDVKMRFLLTCYLFNGEDIFFQRDDRDERESGDVSDLSQAISEFVNELGPTKTFLIGHSYGGWAAMKLALLAGYSGVYTVDPISRVDCSFTNPWGCTRAPRDIADDDRRQIADNSDSWLNFYQRQTWYLRSSRIPEADSNHRIEAEHTEIDSHPDVWDMTTATMIDSLKDRSRGIAMSR